jgi:hypothetical protein
MEDSDMEYTTDYFWVVICKNRRFHHKGNTSYQHQIPLGETDPFSSPPMLTEDVKVCCDVCHQEYRTSQKKCYGLKSRCRNTSLPTPCLVNRMLPVLLRGSGEKI